MAFVLTAPKRLATRCVMYTSVDNCCGLVYTRRERGRRPLSARRSARARHGAALPRPHPGGASLLQPRQPDGVPRQTTSFRHEACMTPDLARPWAREAVGGVAAGDTPRVASGS